MNKDERTAKIEALEAVRGTRVISYLTADRGVASTQISEDAQRILYDHVRSMGKVPALDLLIYSRGGDAMLPWPLVNMLRSFCDRFAVLVPFRAHSAATLIALGADEIVMTPLGQLTPIEPTVKMPFSPDDKANPGQKVGINVEDVVTYFSFVRDRAAIESEEGRTAALSALTRDVHPVALGNLQRSHQLATLQAKKLLQLHMDGDDEDEAIDEIVNNLVARLWAHEYKIGREEARALNLKVKDATPEEDRAIWEVFEGYEGAMHLRDPITPSNSFTAGQSTANITDITLAYIESREQTDAFVMDLQLSRPLVATPPGQPQQFGPQVQISVTRQEWVRE